MADGLIKLRFRNLVDIRLAEMPGGRLGATEVPTDRAISVAMIVNELITNAAKSAYNGNTDGQIWFTLADAGRDHVATSARDEGAELPADFNLDKPNGLGMRSSRLS